jgi:hypothetical protein
MIADELSRRRSRNDLLENLFRARPGVWIPVPELIEAGGLCGWRSRVADVRQRLVRADAGAIEWNGQPQRSAYRYVPSEDARIHASDTRKREAVPHGSVWHAENRRPASDLPRSLNATAKPRSALQGSLFPVNRSREEGKW